ncbi:MAG TPA: class IV adenylate cyclase [Humisphaera sp.]|nr:class IV adenylate cyclase [Humisphaera sp.]
MPVEIEAKMSVEGLAATRTKVLEVGGKLLGKYLETNTFFDSEDRSLLAADKGLRLRHKRNIDTGEEHYIITYKGPRQPGALKSREEVELMVEGAAETVKLMECLGYRPVLSFEKRRESFALDGCEVDLDELPYLGTYVEVEGPSEQAVMRVRQTLGLSDRPLIKAGYVSMLSSYLQERGKNQREIKFGAPL